MRALLASVILALAGSLSASAEPVLKVMNFTADWCPNCQILNPRLDEAIASFESGAIERIDLDVTAIRRGSSPVERAAVQTAITELAAEHKAPYLIGWYGGITGIAVAIAADTGEPITCFMRPMTVDEIQGELRLAKILAEKARPGERKPEGADCPVLN